MYIKRIIAIFIFMSKMFCWKSKRQSCDCAPGNGHNKLRTYRLFKKDYGHESYVTHPMSWKHKKALAQFRCSVAPIRLETGRYENLPVEQRTCFSCTDEVEDELHVITNCPLYTDLRELLFCVPL